MEDRTRKQSQNSRWKIFSLKRVVPERLTKTWWVNSLSKKFVLRSLNKNMVILLKKGTEKFISILLAFHETIKSAHLIFFSVLLGVLKEVNLV